MQLLLSVAGILALIAVPLVGFDLGLESGPANVGRLWRNPRILARFSLASFVLMPAIPVALRLARGTSYPVLAGLVLISMTPPMPGMLAESRKLRGDAEIALAWQMTALLLSLITIPITLFVVERTLRLNLHYGIASVAARVLLVYALPVVAGMFLHKLAPSKTQSIRRRSEPLAKIAMLLILVLILIIGLPPMIKLGALPNLVILVFVAAAVVIGLLLGGPPQNLRPILACGLALRFPAPAIVLARLNHTLLTVIPVIVSYLLFGFVLLEFYARWLKPRTPIARETASSTRERRRTA